MPKSEAGNARWHERQRQRERSKAEQSVCRRRGMEAEPDEAARFLEWVYRRSLTAAETGARWLRSKKAKALWITIEQSEREAPDAAAEVARLAKLKREHDNEVRLKGLVILSDDNDVDHGSSSDNLIDSPPVANSYSCADVNLCFV
ncbi:Phosphorylated carbohydrates phosphatase [Hordeum vulgare]|nr:Phosphorylated carbohydrates phosphatase [Hordeum vulgare]